MRRFALLLGFGLWLMPTLAVAQNCDGFTDVLASRPVLPGCHLDYDLRRHQGLRTVDVLS